MKYYESNAYGAYCKRVYGSDLKQMGMVTMDELALFFREVTLPENARILDMGCGIGHLSELTAETYKSRVTGIDLDEEAISCAKKSFQNNPSLDFVQMDFNKEAFGANSFDLIYFFDTLYFTGSIEKLRLLLDKCLTMLTPGGQLAIFWSNNKMMYDMPLPAAENTQVGIWGKDRQLHAKAFDLTQRHRQYWPNSLAALRENESVMQTELDGAFYEDLLKESTFFAKLCEQGDEGGIYRWLYVFSKDDSAACQE